MTYMVEYCPSEGMFTPRLWSFIWLVVIGDNYIWGTLARCYKTVLKSQTPDSSMFIVIATWLCRFQWVGLLIHIWAIDLFRLTDFLLIKYMLLLAIYIPVDKDLIPLIATNMKKLSHSSVRVLKISTRHHDTRIYFRNYVPNYATGYTHVPVVWDGNQSHYRGAKRVADR